MEVYISNREIHSKALEKIKSNYNSISFFRLTSIVLMLLSLFYYIKTQNSFYGITSVLLLAVFLVLMRIHNKLNEQKTIKQALVAINQNEISYLKKEKNPFENGIEFNDFTHPYSYDLDIFGNHSLFQNLNRTHTYVGKKTLAKQLLTIESNEEILKNQVAIKELTDKLEWRQEFMAFAKISNDNRSLFTTLMHWSKSVSAPISKESVALTYIAPALFVGSIVAYFITDESVYLSYTSFLFVFNMSIFGKFYKRITLEINNAENVDKIINSYGLLVRKIEEETFTSEKLIDLQQQLKHKNEKASLHLMQLSALFAKMDSVGNFVTTLLFNGTFLYHLHTLRSFIAWKKENGAALEHWMEVIGEFDKLQSLANFSYNNRDFAFPTLNANFEISFSNLSHPLLNENTRVGNDVNFQPQSFMILTGSNMSGKSTFLRSLGINMVLTGIGAAVCADKANVHPLPILVSMRLSDSLSDSESYFYAEIKRLKLIMDKLENNRAFVLLDEILRGTNSDDKRNGTIEVVKKMIAKNAIGAIATHDIEVCLTTNEYPNQLINNCFEVEIINDDLHFDYKLREGICKNKSATFLMKKMGVI
jgi:hypothetical protein